MEEFAALGRFFREPVKSYSAGMRARLAFALQRALVVGLLQRIGDRPVLRILAPRLAFARWLVDPRSPLAARVAEHDVIAQIKAKEENLGRWFQFKSGKISSGFGIHPNPDVTIAFKNATIGAELLTRFLDYTDRNTCILFGDGAGAVVVSASDEPGGTLGVELTVEPQGAYMIWLPAGGSDGHVRPSAASRTVWCCSMRSAVAPRPMTALRWRGR